MRMIWKNGDFLPESEANISVYDSALMFGDMVFEMTRSFNKTHHFKLTEHLNRLYKGLKILRIPIKYTINDLEKIIIELAKKNEKEFKKDDEHRIMINVSRGLLSIYESTGKIGTNIIITDFPLRWTVSGMGKYFSHGIKMVTVNQKSIPSRLLDNRIKSRSRMHLQMANIQASMIDKNAWALLEDEDGNITEGTGDNFFIVKIKNDKHYILTPKGKNILRGISRDYIFEIIDGFSNNVNNYIIKEKNITKYDVYEASEAFITGTPFCMLPVSSLNGIDIHSPGYIYNSLLKHWSNNVHVDIKKQIIEWDKTNKKSNSNSPSPYGFKK